MTLAPLAQTADLVAKGVDVSNTPLVAVMLDVASAVIRDAAKSSISEETSTVKVIAPHGKWLTLPGPVTAVSAVLLDGVADTDWKFIAGRLWRPWGWDYLYTHLRPFRPTVWEPVELTITYTHGYAIVPADIVNLCVDLVKLGIQEAGQKAQPAGVLSVSTTIDDYTKRIQWSENARSVMELPDLTKQWLATRFGNGVYVTGEMK